MKMVKVRPNTINRMRELEVLKDELKVAGSDSPSGEGSSAIAGEVLQGLYAFSQTEAYIPNPVVDVIIVPLVLRLYSLFLVRVLSQKIILATSISMYRLCYLKEQPIYHVRFFIYSWNFNLMIVFAVKGVAKVAKKLGFDYAEAVVRPVDETLMKLSKSSAT